MIRHCIFGVLLIVLGFSSVGYCAEVSNTEQKIFSDSQSVPQSEQVLIINKLSAKIEFLEKQLLVKSSKSESDELIKWGTVAAAILAASIAAVVAIINQKSQAKQNRLLKSIEIIMSSVNGYQASVRTENLDVFLDDATRRHLDGIKDRFSGTEYTELAVSLAQAMSEKAKTPEEVLLIWQSVVNKKHSITHAKYPPPSGS